MLKNIFKFAVIGSLVFNPLISLAEPHPADQIDVSKELGLARANLRTVEGKQALFNFFTSLSKADQKDYVDTLVYHNREMKKQLELAQMKIAVIRYDAKASSYISSVIFWATVLPGGYLMEPGSIQRAMRLELLKSMNPKFLKGGLWFSSVALTGISIYALVRSAKKGIIYQSDFDRVSAAIEQITEELNHEREMIETLSAYLESNQ